MKTSLLKSALRNNDIESQKNLAYFQIYRNVVYKGELHCLRGMFQKVDRQGAHLNVWALNMWTKHQLVKTTLSVLINLLICQAEICKQCVYFEFNKNLKNQTTQSKLNRMIFVAISQTMVNWNYYQSIGDQCRRETVKQTFSLVI